ncbi:MAG: hypothetical protein KGM16_11180 [Bacteroidota bacterium]|nr:hypothetical protein [Bacteroidota bacterium]
MKDKTNKSWYVFLTKSEASAREVLALTFTTYTYEFLKEHLHMWLNHLTEHPDAEILFERLDEILENQSTSELMKQDCYLEGIGQNSYARFVGLFIFLLQLVRCSYKVYGKTIRKKKENAWEMKKSSATYRKLIRLVKTNDVQLVQQTLLESIIRTTGRDYYQYFLKSLTRSIKRNDPALLQMEKDPDVAIHKNEIVVFVSLRCFIDSSFFLFGRRGNGQ